ncbi:beta-ketoacyl synthase N-terminal-like domain-containing protein [Streptomyces sp. NPDC087425]|uniref:beta-ketoacyl synthase N-terminal-like domain-containing protein n=1 Tax=Streptomyces sp. NPDC087425 TaxID=3365787 RepID=UPI003800E894
MIARPQVAEAAVSGVGVTEPPVGVAPGEAWFNHRSQLGPRGYKYLPEACQYLLAAARAAVAGSDGLLERCPEERRGAVVGTNSAVAELHSVIDRTTRTEGANFVSPMTAPFFSVNLVGARLSTEHLLKGFNLTVTSPRVAGVEALHLAAHEVAGGRAEVVLAGATEAPDPYAADALPETGAAVLVLCPRALARPGTTLLRSCLLFLPPRALSTATGRERAERIVVSALDSVTAGLDGADAIDVRLVADGSPVARAVSDAVRGQRGPDVCPATEVPRAGSLEAVALLAEGVRSGCGRARLVVTAAREGNVAIAMTTTKPLPDQLPQVG